MGQELLFGLMLLALLAAWLFWVVSIASDSRAGMMASPVAVAVLVGAVVVVNGERQDSQRRDFRAQIERFIDEVVASEKQAYRTKGAYTDELPKLGDEVLSSDGGPLQDEKTIESSLSAEGNQFTVTGKIDSESYTLEVIRSKSGQLEETRTCRASVAAGCNDGEW